MSSLLNSIKAPKGFSYFAGPQRTAEWFDIRLGKVTASRLDDWLSVSRAEKTKGKPLKARLDYEKEILFERAFGTAFDNFISPAMQDGIDYEDFARQQYEKICGVKVFEVGCWYNEHFVASPDGGVGDDGLVEIKIVRDNSFTTILSEGVPQKWWRQIQGQLWASGRAWCDFIAVNLNTKKVKVIRVYPDPEFIEWLELAVPEPLNQDISVFDMENVFDFMGDAPAEIEQNNQHELGDW
jgi:hypothetical protein